MRSGTAEPGVGAGLRPAQKSEPAPSRHKRQGETTLAEVVRVLKSFSARHINQFRDNRGIPVWQRNYYERILRNEDELDRARRYIADNPARWALDTENPANFP